MVQRRILGVDPGAGGALVLVGGQKQLLAVHDMPTVRTDTGKRRIEVERLASTVRALNKTDGIDAAVIELVGPMPRDGSAGSFWFGKAAGLVEGVLAGLSIPCRLVAPQVWKRRLDVPRDKNGARARATELFRDGSHWPLVKHDGRAEAALIALWGWMDECCGTW